MPGKMSSCILNSNSSCSRFVLNFLQSEESTTLYFNYFVNEVESSSVSLCLVSINLFCGY